MCFSRKPGGRRSSETCRKSQGECWCFAALPSCQLIGLLLCPFAVTLLKGPRFLLFCLPVSTDLSQGNGIRERRADYPCAPALIPHIQQCSFSAVAKAMGHDVPEIVFHHAAPDLWGSARACERGCPARGTGCMEGKRVNRGVATRTLKFLQISSTVLRINGRSYTTTPLQGQPGFQHGPNHCLRPAPQGPCTHAKIISQIRVHLLPLDGHMLLNVAHPPRQRCGPPIYRLWIAAEFGPPALHQKAVDVEDDQVLASPCFRGGSHS